jgi:hypothetical protein
MDIVFHIGANCTDGEKLIRSLTLNTDTLAAQGIAVPNPTRYRRLLRETMESLGGLPPAPGTRETLLAAIMDDPACTRLVMSNPTFICLPNRVFEGGGFYRVAALKLLALRSLFPQDQIHLHMGIRNPATFVPALWEQAKRSRFSAFMGGIEPTAILWSDVVTLIKQTLPDVSLTLWCNEDTPLIWAEIMRRLTGTPVSQSLKGEFDLLMTIMSAEGMGRFLKYLGSHPPQSDAQTRRVIAAFLDKYALADAIEEEVDLPGWDEPLVARMTQIYEADIQRIAQNPDVTFITA